MKSLLDIHDEIRKTGAKITDEQLRIPVIQDWFVVKPTCYIDNYGYRYPQDIQPIVIIKCPDGLWRPPLPCRFALSDEEIANFRYAAETGKDIDVHIGERGQITAYAYWVDGNDLHNN